MPANFKVDQAATFASVILLTCNPKLKFGSATDQECTKDGTPKWELEVAAGFLQFGKVTNEVLKIGMASHENPATGIPPYSPVTLTGFELGVMEKAKDGQVIGFQVWYRAEDIRSNLETSARKAAS
jgi:hypothetical protein